MTRHALPMLAILLAMSVCAPGCADLPPTQTAEQTRAWLYATAVSLVAEGRLPDALATLQQLLEAGDPTPSRVLASGAFTPMLDDSGSRARLRALLRRHVRESRVTIVGPDEPGDALIVEIRVVSQVTGEPVPGAVVSLVQADAAGEELLHEACNPRLFGFARMDGEGVVEIRTIRPGYSADEGPDEPARIHLGVRAYGFDRFADAIQFDDDPRLTPERRAASEEAGVPIFAVEEDAEGNARARVTIVVVPDA